MTYHSTEKQLNAKETFLNDILERKKKTTYKGYKRGLELFEEYYQKDCDQILAEAKQKFKSEDVLDQSHFDRKIEAFYKWMLEKQEYREAYALTSARNYTLGIIQFFNFYRIPTNAKIPMPPPTTKTYIPKIEELRRMFQVSDLKGKVVLSLGLDLSWRIIDFINLKKSDIPDLNQETPIPISRITQKENTISATFISSESVELLKAYLPTIPKDKEYLFPSFINGSHMKDESLNKILKVASEKAKIKIPEKKRFTFHSLRKRFLSTCATLNIDSEYAKLMVGKSTELGQSFETYLQDATFIESFKKVREETLSLSNGTIKQTMDSKDAQIEQLQKELAQTKAMFKLLVEAQSEQVTKTLFAKLKAEQPKDTDVAHGIDLIPKEERTFELLKQLADIEKKKQEAEYRKLIENGNGNDNGHDS